MATPFAVFGRSARERLREVASVNGGRTRILCWPRSENTIRDPVLVSDWQEAGLQGF